VTRNRQDAITIRHDSVLTFANDSKSLSLVPELRGDE
jgi:hypothetical protein